MKKRAESKKNNKERQRKHRDTLKEQGIERLEIKLPSEAKKKLNIGTMQSC